jgi:Domain of unknown function (DUF1932)
LGSGGFGYAEALIAELSSSQPRDAEGDAARHPDMYDKAYRWVGEMEAISDFLTPTRRLARCAAVEAEAAPADDNAIRMLKSIST